MIARPSLIQGAALALAVCFFGLAVPAVAQAAEPSIAETSTDPRASLSAQASSEVSQDQVQITLVAELASATQEQVAQELNQRLQAAMKLAQGHAGIDVHNGAYRIWTTTDRDGKLAQWRGRAELLLQSTDFAAASQLAATLSPHMSVAGFVFSVSDGVRAAEEQKLLTRAVAAFRERALALAQALGYTGYRLKDITLDGTGLVPITPMPRMMSAMVASAEAPPVALQGGRERVTVSVQGTVFLLPARTATGQ